MKKSIIGFIVLIILVAAGYLLFIGNKQFKQESFTNENMARETTLEGSENDSLDTATQYEIIYTDSGYSPSELTIKIGDTVTWKNESSSGMWTASAMHPTHTLYSGTSLEEHCKNNQSDSFDECSSIKSGESWSFTFEKQGTWPYHNHVQTGHFGKIIVK